MGLGKTACTLTAIVDLINSLQVCKVLVVGPKKVAKFVWAEEAQSWEHTKQLRMSVVIGTEKQRLAALNAPADIHTINVENLQWLETTLIRHKELVLHGDRKRSPYDLIVCDESDLFKNRATKRFKVLKRMARLANYVVLLTGTPATEGMQHLWSQFALLDDGKRLGGTFTGFLGMHFKDVGYQFPKWVLKSKQAEQIIHNKIADITFTLKAEDHLQLPKENRIVRYVHLDPAERRVYDTFLRDAVLPLVNGEVLTAASASALAIKLAQLANGNLYDTERKVHCIHKRKLEELQLLFTEAQGSPLLVGVEFLHDRDMIVKEFGAKVFDDKRSTLDGWNAGKYDMMVIHPRSGGHGVNLQHGPGHTLIRYGMLHSLGLFLQLFARLHRSGQKSPFVNHYLILTRDTIDEEILRLVEQKRFSHEGLLDAMKRYMTKLQS